MFFSLDGGQLQSSLVRKSHLFTSTGKLLRSAIYKDLEPISIQNIQQHFSFPLHFIKHKKLRFIEMYPIFHLFVFQPGKIAIERHLQNSKAKFKPHTFH